MLSWVPKSTYYKTKSVPQGSFFKLSKDLLNFVATYLVQVEITVPDLQTLVALLHVHISGAWKVFL